MFCTRLEAPGICPVCGMDMEKFVDLGAALPLSEREREDMNLRTERVKMRMLARQIRTLGQFEVDETKDKTVAAWTDGRIDKIHADFTGVPLEKGRPLFDLYSPELYSAQNEMFVAARAGNQDSQHGSAKEFALQNLESVRKKLRLLGLTKEQIQIIEKQKGPSISISIPSPTTGIVIEKMAHEGMYVKQGQALYRIADLSRLWLMLDVHERDVPWIAVGQRVHLVPTAFPGRTFSGTVGFIDPVLSSKTRTVRVRVEVPNTEGLLKPGMYATAFVFAQLAADGTLARPKLDGKFSCPMHPLQRHDDPDQSCGICGMKMRATDPGKSSVPDYVPAVPRESVLTTGVRHLAYIEDWVERDREGNPKLDDDGFAVKLDSPLYKPIEITLGPLAAEWEQGKDGTWRKLGEYYVVQAGLPVGTYVVTKAHFLIDSALELTAKPSLLNVPKDK